MSSHNRIVSLIEDCCQRGQRYLFKASKQEMDYVLMFENGEMRLVEIIPGIGRRGVRENDGVGEFSYDVLQELL
jgi:hypothetical protein